MEERGCVGKWSSYSMQKKNFFKKIIGDMQGTGGKKKHIPIDTDVS